MSELLALRGGEDEQALELAERAVRLTDRMERLSLVQTQEDQEDGEAAAPRQRVREVEGPAGAAVQTGEAEEGKGDRTPGDASDAIWTLPPELLALNSRNIMRRLNLGRLLVRADGGRPKEEALWYLFQALNDSRKPGLRGNPIIYSQALAAVGAAHISSMLATVRDLCLGGSVCEAAVVLMIIIGSDSVSRSAVAQCNPQRAPPTQTLTGGRYRHELSRGLH